MERSWKELLGLGGHRALSMMAHVEGRNSCYKKSRQWIRTGRECVLEVVEEYVLGLGWARGCEEVKGGHLGR